LRSKIVSTGLFDRDRAVRTYVNFFGSVQVRTGGRLVTFGWGAHPYFWQHVKPATVLTDDQAQAAVARLTEWILEPASVLPARAWESRKPRAYVPSRYAICYTWARAPDYFGRSLRPSRALRVLPAAARDLLHGRARRYDPFGVLPEQTVCSEVAIEEARVLYAILSEAEFERDPFASGKTLVGDNVSNNVRFRAPPPNHTVHISFEPILPHGQWEAMPG
jgi:hypothetical protein